MTPSEVPGPARESARALADAIGHHRAGRLAAALDAYEHALASGAVATVPLLEAIAAVAWGLGRTDGATKRFRQMIAVAPAAAMAHRNLGLSAAELGNHAIALRSCARAVACEPANHLAWSAIASARADVGDHRSSMAAWRRVLGLSPGESDALYNLGVGAQRADRWQEAVARYRRVLAIDPGRAAAEGNLGACLSELGRTTEAIRAFEAAVACEPATFRRRHALHLEYLKAGLFEAAWKAITLADSPSIGDLRGRNVLLYDTCGFGDFIQFMRYVPLVSALARQVRLQVPASLLGLARRSAGPAQVVSAGIAPPAHDIAVRLLDLPRLFGTTEETIPAASPYLSADPERLRRWLPRIDRHRGLAVGFVWAGNPTYPLDRLRSPGLEAMRPLIEDGEGATFHSLQVGPGRDELQRQGMPSTVLDLAANIQDFDDTAAIIAALDLVISPCTAVAHLAAALGKPTWVMLRHASDWRWMLDRGDSPWYPSLRLFRQHEPGDWKGVVASLRTALSGAARTAAERPGAGAV
jgi:tetratricopeptide (TPR) repeat protein